jgi:hypothetical protein
MQTTYFIEGRKRNFVLASEHDGWFKRVFLWPHYGVWKTVYTSGVRGLRPRCYLHLAANANPIYRYTPPQTMTPE